MWGKLLVPTSLINSPHLPPALTTFFFTWAYLPKKLIIFALRCSCILMIVTENLPLEIYDEYCQGTNLPT